MFSNFFAALALSFRTRPQMAAIGYMLISTTCFSAMSMGVRILTPELHATTIVMLRNGLTLLLLLPWLLHDHRTLLHTQRLGAHAWRGAVGAVGMITWTYCLTIMPLANATALSFTAPIFTTVFAMLFLGEKGDWIRWLGLLAGFGGTLILLRPSAEGFDTSALLVIFATATWAVTGLFVKSLSRTEPAMRMVVYMNFFMLLVATPFGIAHWQAPSAHGWGVLAVISGFSILMHFSMAKAYSLAPVTTLMPFDFTRLITTALFAYLLFGETSDALAWLGAAVIVTSAVMMARRDVKAPPLG
jgi:drug/metabolite transporter (DMT)-like permease